MTETKKSPTVSELLDDRNEDGTFPSDSKSTENDNRADDGRFRKGKSGNPNGRPKGARNQINLLKETLELELRESGQHRMQAVLDKAYELALEGDRTMLKLLLELHMSKGTTDTGSAGGEKVSINIRGPSKAAPQEPSHNLNGWETETTKTPTEEDTNGDEESISDER